MGTLIVGDLRFLSDLLQLSDDFPSRVHLVLGNRDINKMRLTQELDPAHLARFPLHKHPGVYWLRSSDKKTTIPAEALPNQFVLSGKAETPAQRLQWILANTMGAPNAFEHRRTELTLQGAADGNNAAVSDEAVCDSFLLSLRKGGPFHVHLTFWSIENFV